MQISLCLFKSVCVCVCVIVFYVHIYVFVHLSVDSCGFSKLLLWFLPCCCGAVCRV